MKIVTLGIATVLLLTVRSFAQDRPDAPQPLTPSALGHFGSSPFDPPTATDSTFVVDIDTGLDTGCTFRSGGPLRFTISVNRVVGDVNPDGTLVDPQALVNGGVVSRFATLRMPAFDVDFDAVLEPPFQPERDRVLLNGRDIGQQGSIAFLTGANNVWKLNEFQIPIEFIRFGRRNIGGAPSPGENVVQILIDQANIANGEELWCTAIDWAEISFDALYPVIMIHGNNSSGAFFSDFNFIGPFQEQRIPFDNSISMTTNTIAAHGDLLGQLIPQKTAEFGAKHVHLVAHSKGGLDSRDFLARTLPPNFGVLSLTTLSTPHRGSAAADYAQDSVDANALFSDNTTRVLLAKQAPPDLGRPNLRVSFVERFNDSNLPLLPTRLTVDDVTDVVGYFSFSADANLDDSVDSSGNPTIQNRETRGTAQPFFIPNSTWAGIIERVYRLLGEVASTELDSITILGRTVFVVRETPTRDFQLNDFLVTLNSARLFPEVVSLKHNHATIASPDVAQLTIDLIQSIRPVR